MRTSPENELLLYCARIDMDVRMQGRISDLLRQDLDWSFVIMRAHVQQVVPLLYTSLRRFAAVMPPDILRQLRETAVSIAARNLVLSMELASIVSLLSRNNVRVVAYKGPVLAVDNYGSLALRQFGDLDIIVDARDYFLHIPDLLRSAGWTLKRAFDWECTYANERGLVHLDVHKRFIYSQMPLNLTFAHIWKYHRGISVAGTLIPTPSVEDMLIILSAQVAKDAAARTIQLLKICDVAELIRAHPGLEWPRLIHQARGLGVLHIMYVAVRAAHELLQIELPADIAYIGKAHPHLHELVLHIRRCVINEKNQASDASLLVDQSRFWAEIRERVSDRWSRRYVVWYLVPTADDFRVLKLPPALAFLYSVVRLFRLAIVRARRLVRR
jgi:hypothetical protein